MPYFKHSELVDAYHVSLKTVHNWIDAAKQGKLELELVEVKSRTYIGKNSNNLITLEKLSNQGKKYRNVRYHKVIRPSKHFYETYPKRQILDIVSNLTIHGEIPRQYNYLDGGADIWDAWVKRLAEEKATNLYNKTVLLIEENLPTIEALLENVDKVNIIDVGAGNGMPVKGLVKFLTDKKILNRYIALDISPTMIDIAKANFKTWFGDSVAFEGHVRDISFERFDDLVVDDLLNSSQTKTINLVLVLGSTPLNFRSSSDFLKVVYNSMGADDLLLFDRKPDNPTSRNYFDFNAENDSSKLSPNHRLILEMMNIDDSLYTVERGFNDRKKMRYIRIRFNTAITIEFEIDKNLKNVTFEKGDTILMLRVWHQTGLETIIEFEKIGFVLLNFSMTKDRQGLMTISGINTQTDIAKP